MSTDTDRIRALNDELRKHLVKERNYKIEVQRVQHRDGN